MPDVAGRARSDPRERLRSGFMSQAVHRVHEWVGLLDHDSDDVRESVRHELDRMADTAGSLGLAEIRDAARVAADQVAVGDGSGALERLVGALRTKRIEPFFATIAVVTGGDDGIVGPLRAACEPIRAYPSIAALEHQVRFDDLQAAIVPGGARPELRRVVAALPGRTYAWGPHGDPMARLAALDDGALSWFDAPFDPSTVLGRVRADVERRLSPVPRVVVAGRIPDALGGLSEALPASVIRAGTAGELIDALRGAELAVLVGDLGDASLSQAVRLVRGHAAAAPVPIVVVGHAPEDVSADEVIPADHLPVDRLRARLEHPAGVHRRDPLTGLPARATVLADLDAELARARRTREVLSVAVVDVDQLSAINQAHGRDAGDDALRLVADALRTGFRSYDLVGRVGGDGFLVALSGCRAAVAARRLEAMQAVLSELATGALAALSVSVGVADSALDLDDVLERADRALLTVRGKGRPGVVGVFR